MKEPPIPRNRTPLVTIALFDADAPNLGARLKDIAAQDYVGPTQTIAIAGENSKTIFKRATDFPWLTVLDKTASESSALRIIAEHADGDFIALLPLHARPHSLWIHECMAVAIEHEKLLGVAPTIAYQNGEAFLQGLQRNDRGVWRGGDSQQKESALSESEVEATVAAGFMISTTALRALLPLDPSLDLTSSCIDLAIRGRAMGLHLYLAKRARVVVSQIVPANSGIFQNARSELILVARHSPDFLPISIVESKLFETGDDGENGNTLRDVLQNAGIELHRNTAEVFTRTIGEVFKRVLKTREELESLNTVIQGLQKEKHELSVVMHREMAWAHELDKMRLDVETRSGRDRERMTAELEQARRAAGEEKNLLQARLADTTRQLEATQQELLLLREQRKGAVVSEARVTELENRWRESESRREQALRELGITQERARSLEDLKRLSDTTVQEQRDKRIEAETEIRVLRDRESRLNTEIGGLRKQIDERAKSIEQIEARLRSAEANIRAAEEGFRAASRTLQQSQSENNNLKNTIKSAETRRDQADRALAALQVEFESNRHALQKLTSELGQERERTGEEMQRTGKEIERATTLISTLEDEIAVLTQRKSSAEQVASELRLRLSEETRRAEGVEKRLEELRENFEDQKQQIVELNEAIAKANDERVRVYESKAALQFQFDELHADHAELVELKITLESKINDLESDRAKLEKERDGLDDNITKLKADAERDRKLRAEEKSRYSQWIAERDKVITDLNASLRDMTAQRDQVMIDRARLAKERDLGIENITILTAERDRLVAERAALRREVEQLKQQLGAAVAANEQLRAGNASLARRLADEQNTVAQLRTAAALHESRIGELERELASARAENAELRGENSKLQIKLAAEAAHAHSLFTKNTELAIDLDAARSQIFQRVSDLALLREQVLRERDGLTARIVTLLEEVRRPRWRGRKLTKDELEFLVTRGAGFVTESIR
ncbi:MAG: hypothetical protein HY286_14125 [Planctomycetes bacterium]|nr:hypothetical protein [Planctomycetota bacterium]